MEQKRTVLIVEDEKSIVDKKTFLDLPMRYRPYRKKYEKMLRFFIR